MTRLALIAVLCACGVAAAQPASPAPDKAKASAAFARGRAQYASGDYRAAAASFLEAYAADPDPGYLFNVGQAFRFAQDCAQAARYYRQFLGAVSSAPNLDKARGYLDEMDACVRRQQPPSPPPPRPPGLTAPAASDDPGATRRHVGLALAGVGLAAIGAGVWFHHDVVYFENRSHAARRRRRAPLRRSRTGTTAATPRRSSRSPRTPPAAPRSSAARRSTCSAGGATPSRRSRSPRRPEAHWSPPASRSEPLRNPLAVRGDLPAVFCGTDKCLPRITHVMMVRWVTCVTPRGEHGGSALSGVLRIPDRVLRDIE